MIEKYTKYFIMGIVFVAFLTGILTHSVESSQYKKLIQEAVLSNNISATKFLIEQGASVNSRYRYNHTLLHSAALYGDINMLKLLVQSGAKLNKNDFGLTAIDSARDNNHSEVVEFLVKYYDNLDRIYQ